MTKSIRFTEGESRTESFRITDTSRVDIISIDTSPKYIVPCSPCNDNPTPNPTTPNPTTGTNIEIPVPIAKGGTSATSANGALFNLGIDISNKQDGAVLAYKTSSGKFEATNNPYQLNVDGGHF